MLCWTIFGYFEERKFLFPILAIKILTVSTILQAPISRWRIRVKNTIQISQQNYESRSKYLLYVNYKRSLSYQILLDLIEDFEHKQFVHSYLVVEGYLTGTLKECYYMNTLNIIYTISPNTFVVWNPDLRSEIDLKMVTGWITKSGDIWYICNFPLFRFNVPSFRQGSWGINGTLNKCLEGKLIFVNV